MLSIIRGCKNKSYNCSSVSYYKNLQIKRWYSIANTVTTTTAESMTSSSSSSSSSPLQLKVISRRLWKSHQETKMDPNAMKRPTFKNPLDEKPWPRSVKIAGAVVASTAIPYSIIWLISSNPTLRHYTSFESWPFHDRIRQHFGTIELNAKSFVDEMENNGIYEPCWYQLPQELSNQNRQQEMNIDELNQSKISMKITILNQTNDDNVNDDIIQSDVVHAPGSMQATRDTLLQLVQYTDTKNYSTATTTTNLDAAVDFEDEESSSSTTTTNNDDTENEMNSTFMNEFEDTSTNIATSTTTTKPLEQQTQSYSTWHALGHAELQQHQQQESSSSKKQLSPLEVEQSRLEYTVQQLQHELTNGTRDVDTISSELKQAKKELSRLKWKRRFQFQ